MSVLQPMEERHESSHRISALLAAWAAGQPEAIDELLELVYDELHRIARRHVARERAGHSLQATGLVNEAYLRLANRDLPQWQDRVHFFAVCSRVMRRILVDHARRRDALKRGGDQIVVTLDDRQGSDARSIDVLALDEAMTRLAELDPRKAHVVELRYFAGLTIQEAARVLDVSTPTVVNDTRFAKAWLFRQLGTTDHEQ